jgi:hypothetical protein
MALCPSRRARPDVGLQCCCPWQWQEEKQEEPRHKQAADWGSDRCSGSGWGPESARQAPAPTAYRPWVVSCSSWVPPQPSNAVRSRNLWSASARGATRPPRMTPPRRGGLARRRSLTPMLLRRRGSWGTETQRRTLRVFSTSPSPSSGERGGRAPQEAVCHVRRQLRDCLPEGSPGSFLGEAGGPESGV